MSWKEEIKKDSDYSNEVGKIMAELGYIAVQSAKRLASLADLAEKNADEELIPLLIKINEINKDRDKSMLMIIKYLKQRETLR